MAKVAWWKLTQGFGAEGEDCVCHDGEPTSGNHGDSWWDCALPCLVAELADDADVTGDGNLHDQGSPESWALALPSSISTTDDRHVRFSPGTTGNAKGLTQGDLTAGSRSCLPKQGVSRMWLLTPSCREVFVQSRLQAIGRARKLPSEVATSNSGAADLDDSLPILFYKAGDVVMMLDRRCSWASNGAKRNGMISFGELPSADERTVAGTVKHVWLNEKGMLKGAAIDDGEETPSAVGEDAGDEHSWLFFGEV